MIKSPAPEEEVKEPKIDWKAATIRRDCLTIAVQMKDLRSDIIDVAEEMYQYVINGKQTTDGWSEK